MTPNTTNFERGTVVLVPFFFTDGTSTKNRPALTLSSTEYQMSRNEVVIAAITSRLRRRLLVGDTRIADWRSSGLIKPSVVTGILWTIKGGMVLRSLGLLSTRDLMAYERVLSKALAL